MEGLDENRGGRSGGCAARPLFRKQPDFGEPGVLPPVEFLLVRYGIPGQHDLAALTKVRGYGELFIWAPIMVVSAVRGTRSPLIRGSA
jgi:hypothetical protein